MSVSIAPRGPHLLDSKLNLVIEYSGGSRKDQLSVKKKRICSFESVELISYLLSVTNPHF